MEIISMQVPDLPFPAIRCVLTFRPYLQYIEDQLSTTKSTYYRNFLQSIADMIRSHPELLEPITDISVLDQYPELIELIRITHLSQVKSDGMLYTLGLPLYQDNQISYFGYSDEFKAFLEAKGPYITLKSDIDAEEFKRNIYRELLHKGYDLPITQELAETMMHLVDNSGTAKHFYKVVRRHQFMNLRNQELLPELRPEWIDYANGVISSHDQLAVPFPFDTFVMEGFFIFSILPDTEEMALSELSAAITQIHLNDEAGTFQRIRQATLSLVDNEHVEIGFLPFLKVNNEYVYHHFFSSISIVFGRLSKHFSREELNNIFTGLVSKSCYSEHLVTALHNEVYRLEDGCGEQDHLKQLLAAEGLNSLKFVPVWHKQDLLGIIELGSRDPDAINVGVLHKLEAALPYYREYFMYQSAAFSDYMSSFIRQRYTAIQESVAWKFNEQVWNALKKIETKDPEVIIATPPVRFEHLLPFYGAVDFRNSSAKQTEAIHSDYRVQLQFLETLLQTHGLEDSIPGVADLAGQVTYWCTVLDEQVGIDEEGDLRQFLEKDSVKLVGQLSQGGWLPQAVAEAYEQDVSSREGRFHEAHNRYEESLQQMNQLLREQLYKAELELQHQVPHYFEKFQSDGLEYSLYAGSSISRGNLFPEHAATLIINWQLDSMLQLAATARAQNRQLTVPFETTQLILVHEHRVDISYRIDERHFDVEGSYSIRYEVIKKRIDKVRLKDSQERLTQPGTIAIVYAQRQSINTYMDKIVQLTNEGRLLPGVEYLELEQLQGIGKLKAIRVHINEQYAAATFAGAAGTAINN